jgi:cysteinyl-tRNA synthetase
VPAALGVIYTTMHDGNSAFDSGDISTGRRALAAVMAMTSILGLNPDQWSAEQSSNLLDTVGALAELAIEQRTAARSRKDFAASDAIRDQLALAGIAVEDTPDGPRWTLKGE